VARRILETEQKALEINLDDRLYGVLAEIGAGQEVARHFFQVGAAAGTIAKTMSAYDKTVSDDVYGPELKGRYVCESRVYKMLDHEYNLLNSRLRKERQDQNFFAFADTVSAINYEKTIKGNGWLGLRFQLHPEKEPNDLVLHVRMLDTDNRLQQQAIGILGVNLIYACYRYSQDPETLLVSLLDNLRGRVMIDMIRLNGPDFQVDHRMLCLWMVKNELSTVAIFGPKGKNLHPSEFLYKYAVLIARGSYRPPTLVQQDMTRNAFEQFRSTPGSDPKKCYFLTEITLDNLRSDGELNEKDFMDRAELLCALNQTVIISNCVQHKSLIAYFSDYKVNRIGLAMGVRKLKNIIWETYEHNQDNLLGAFGELFLENVRFYIYPARREGESELMQINNIEIPKAIQYLYQHILENKHIVPVVQFNPDILHVYHKRVLKQIQEGDSEWEAKVSPEIAKLIKEKRLFGYST
jgi:hypothetical protein